MTAINGDVVLGKIGVLDCDVHPMFRTFSAGNFGEVAPERLSPFSWSLVGKPMEFATRRLTVKMWGERAWTQGEFYTFLGYIKCRPYHNYSSYAQLAASVPGVMPDDVGAAYFEGMPAPAPHQALVENRFVQARSLTRLARELALGVVRLRNLEERVEVLEMAALVGVGNNASDLANQGVNLLRDCWYEHILSTTTLVPLAKYQDRVLERVCADPDDVIALLGRPDELVWNRLHQQAEIDKSGSAAFLRYPFYEVAHEHPLWSRFSARHQVEGVGAEREESFLQPAEALAGMYRGMRYRVMAGVTKTVAESMVCREHSKSLVMRLLHVFRSLAPMLAKDNSIPSQLWSFLTIDELLGTPKAGGLQDIAAERSEMCADAVLVGLSENIRIEADGSIVEPAAAGSHLVPRGVAGGIAHGVTVRPHENIPDVDFIVVCDAADADVVPLLRFAAGVVSRRGSAMSHLAILCREYGIPCVVGAQVDHFPSGAIVSVDGSKGRVNIHE